MAPANDLPYVDEHSISVLAKPNTTWEALLLAVERSVASPVSPRLAGLLGCRDVDASGPRPLAPGSAFPGFHVEATEQPRELALVGSHRFSDYALIFRLEELGEGHTKLSAETRATFPGLKGSAYRAMVIGTRGHIVVTRRILGAVKRRAERS